MVQPIWMGATKDDPIWINQQKFITLIIEAFLKLCEIHFNDCHANNLVATVDRIGKVITTTIRCGSKRIIAACLARHGLLKIGSKGKIFANKTGFLLIIGSGNGQALPINNVAVRGFCNEIDLLELSIKLLNILVGFVKQSLFYPIIRCQQRWHVLILHNRIF